VDKIVELWEGKDTNYEYVLEPYMIPNDHKSWLHAGVQPPLWSLSAGLGGVAADLALTRLFM
jgi:hypothetical protein